ncbi:Uncharacterised protein [Vibrio cholerae]|nr:Uncharacterised protein [Vibrio cholerae]
MNKSSIDLTQKVSCNLSKVDFSLVFLNLPLFKHSSIPA